MPALTWPAVTPGGPVRLTLPAPVTSLAPLLAAVHTAIAAHTGQHDFGVGVRSTCAAPPRRSGLSGASSTPCVRLRPGDTGPERALAHAEIPFADVVRLVRPQRTRQYPLYQVIVAVQDSPAVRLDLAGCTVDRHPRDDEPWTGTDLLIELFAEDGRLWLTRDPATVSADSMIAIAEALGATAGITGE